MQIVLVRWYLYHDEEWRRMIYSHFGTNHRWLFRFRTFYESIVVALQRYHFWRQSMFFIFWNYTVHISIIHLVNSVCFTVVQYKKNVIMKNMFIEQFHILITWWETRSSNDKHYISILLEYYFSIKPQWPDFSRKCLALFVGCHCLFS